MSPDELARKLYNGELDPLDLEVQRMGLRHMMAMGLEGYMEEVTTPRGQVVAVRKMNPKLINDAIRTARLIMAEEKVQEIAETQVVFNFGAPIVDE